MDERYFDCRASLQPTNISENIKSMGLQMPRLPRHDQLDAATWDEQEHEQAEARHNAFVHTNIEFLLKHCGAQGDPSKATREDHDDNLRFTPSPSVLSRQSTVLDITAMAATAGHESHANTTPRPTLLTSHNSSRAIVKSPRREPRTPVGIPEHQFMPLGMIAAMMASTKRAKGAKTSPAKRKLG